MVRLTGSIRFKLALIGLLTSLIIKLASLRLTNTVRLATFIQIDTVVNCQKQICLSFVLVGKGFKVSGETSQFE